VGAQKEGLGKLPGNVVSVANLSLFNSSENPYRKYQRLDNLAGHPTKSSSDTRPPPAPPRPLQSAPHTVAEGYTMPLMGSQVPQHCRRCPARCAFPTDALCARTLHARVAAGSPLQSLAGRYNGV
jgi:hypothetical protein